MEKIGCKQTGYITIQENLLAVTELQQSELQLQQFVLQPTRRMSCKICHGRELKQTGQGCLVREVTIFERSIA